MENRLDNRKLMPNVAEIVDQMNEYFGPVRVIACEDNETGVKAGEFREWGES